VATRVKGIFSWLKGPALKIPPVSSLLLSHNQQPFCMCQYGNLIIGPAGANSQEFFNA